MTKGCGQRDGGRGNRAGERPIPVSIQLLTHESHHEPGFRIAACRAVCTRCGVAGWGPGHSNRSVELAIEAMRRGCLGNEPGRRRYVPVAATTPARTSSAPG